MKFLFFFLVLFSGQVLAREQPSRDFRALIIFDKTNSALGQAYKADASKMKKLFHSMQHALKVRMHLRICPKQSFSVADLTHWIQKARPSKDIAFVYYVGPQGEAVPSNSPWPSIVFSGDDRSGTISVDSISQMVRKQNPRLGIVLVDCYEKIFEKHSFPSLSIPKWKSKYFHERVFLREMYLKDKGTMTLCSHKQGEIGYGLIMGHHTGGSLTRAFLIEMRTPNGFLKTIPPKVERITGRWICPEQHIVTQFDIIDHPLAPTIPRSRAFCLKNIDS